MVSFSTSPKRPLKQTTMVLVTDQYECRQSILQGRAVADRTGTRLEVINVAPTGAQRNHEALEFLYQVSKDSGAMMMIHYSEEPAKFITRLLQEEAPKNVVTGMPGSEDSLLHKIWTRFEATDFYTVDREGVLRPVTLGDRVIA